MRNLFALLFICFCATSFAGGPWLQPAKSGFFQVQATLPVGTYNRLFLSNNKQLDLNREVTDMNFQAYLEYGITDKINIVTVLPYKYISTGATQSTLTNPTLLPSGKLSGFSNYKLALKYRVSDKNYKIAISIQSSFNSTTQDLEKGLVTGYQTNSIGLYGHIGKGFSENFYSFIEGGFNSVSNNFSDFYEIHYEIGYQFKPSFWGAFTLDLRETLRNGNYRNENLRQTGFYTNNQEYFAFGLKTSYELKNKIGFNAAFFGAFSGNYVAYLSTYSIGIYKKW